MVWAGLNNVAMTALAIGCRCWEVRGGLKAEQAIFSIGRKGEGVSF